MEMSYDACGRLKMDLNRDVDSIRYNRIGLPEVIYMGLSRINQIYSADGTLLRRVTKELRGGSTGSGGTTGAATGGTASGAVSGGLISIFNTDTIDYVGPFVYKNSALERTMVSGGYVKANVPYYFVRDYQGNVRQVVNGSTGAVVQENHYYPYGGLFGESSATALSSNNGVSVSPYKFGGKEQIDLSDNSFLDFAARMLDYQLGRFHTPDPLHWDTPGISVYTYCASNPVNYIDPTGLDVYELSPRGYIVRKQITKETAFVILDENGESFGRIDLPEGSVTHFMINKGADFSDAFKVLGDKNAIKLFQFLRHSMEVEFSLLLCGDSDQNGVNFISTTHKVDAENGAPWIFGELSSIEYPIREISHTHPGGTEKPSDGEKGDLHFASIVYDKNYKNVIFNIWVPQKDSPIRYYPPNMEWEGKSTKIIPDDLTKKVESIH